LLSILGVAFLLRAALVLATPDFQPVGDPADYDRIASSLIAGDGFGGTAFAAPGTPTALRPPAYPLLLASLYELVGHSWTAARLTGAVLGTVSVLLLYLLARTVWGDGVGLVAAGLAAVFPPLIMLNGSLMSESLFLPLELGALVAVLEWRRRPQLRLAALVGLLCGLALLTRTVGVALLLGVIIGFLTTQRPVRLRLSAAGIAVLVAILLIAPWTIRNAIVFHAFVPLSTQGGPTAAGVYNVDAFKPGEFYATWRPPWWVREFRPLIGTTLDEAEIDARLTKSAVRYAVGHPDHVASAVGLNTLRLFLEVGHGHTRVARAWYDEEGVPVQLQPVVSWSARLASVFALATLAAAAVRRLRLRAGPVFIWASALLLYASVIPLHGANRYGAPLAPFVLIMVSLGALAICNRSRG
jgi:4-amino-4-deoxy-L-arabinose transferase-like glycosyltransferase